MKLILPILISHFFFSPFIFSQTPQLVLTNRNSGAERIIEEGKVVTVVTPGDSIYRGALRILNDSVIVVEETSFLLSSITKIRARSSMSLAAGGVLTTLGVITTVEGVMMISEGNDKADEGIGGAVSGTMSIIMGAITTPVGIVLTSTGIVLLTIGSNHKRENWAYSIRRI